MALRSSIEEAAKHYPNSRSAIMPALYLAQKEYGHLSGDLLREVADILDVPEIWVYEVSSFYGMFHTEPVGKFHIKICTNLSCQLLEAESMLAHLEKELAIEAGTTTPDGRFTLSCVECLGACEGAPMMQVNDGYFHMNLTTARIDEILVGLRKEAAE
ncbi:MAG: NAD(P)H-dependent oxidoreductase subunit E [Rhodospirillales bacterium]